MKAWIRKFIGKFLMFDYMEFNRKLTDIEKVLINDFVNGKREMGSLELPGNG